MFPRGEGGECHNGHVDLHTPISPQVKKLFSRNSTSHFLLRSSYTQIVIRTRTTHSIPLIQSRSGHGHDLVAVIQLACGQISTVRAFNWINTRSSYLIVVIGSLHRISNEIRNASECCSTIFLPFNFSVTANHLFPWSFSWVGDVLTKFVPAYSSNLCTCGFETS